MRGRRIAWLSPTDPPERFPGIETALDDPDGLLAAGGDLSPGRLLCAYSRGIFPWYDDGQPILWWSPNPRCIVRPDAFRLSRRMQRARRASGLVVTFNRAFNDVVRHCAAPRMAGSDTWITTDMQEAYGRMHLLGWAHSVELWRDERLVGGVYGLAIGRVFFGESMFSREDNASKFALYALCRVLAASGFAMLDCQTVSRHLLSLGAITLPRRDFVAELKSAATPMTPFSAWPGSPQSLADLSPSADPTALQ